MTLSADGAQAVTCTGSMYYKEGLTCLYMQLAAATWNTARKNCVQMGGHLVKIGDSQSQEDVNNIINAHGSSEKYWIGLTKLSGDEWKWNDSKHNALLNKN